MAQNSRRSCQGFGLSACVTISKATSAQHPPVHSIELVGLRSLQIIPGTFDSIALSIAQLSTSA